MTAVTINFPDAPVELFRSVETLDDLRAFSTTELTGSENMLVEGAEAVGDGDGGLFVWDPDSSATDNGATVIRPDDVAALEVGRWLSLGIGGGGGDGGGSGLPAYYGFPDAVTEYDNAPEINLMLSDTGKSIIELPDEDISVKSSVIVRPGKTLRGVAGQTRLYGISSFNKNTYQNAIVAFENGATNWAVRDLIIDANKLYHNDTALTANRINGIMPYRASYGVIENVRAKNAQGYGIYLAGNLSGSNLTHHIRVLNAFTENCNVGLEPHDAADILVDGYENIAGDGDIVCEAQLHPYLYCKRITVRNFKLVGTGVGINILALNGDQENITLENGYVKVASGGSPLVVSAAGGDYYNRSLKLKNLHIECTYQEAAILSAIADGVFEGVDFIATAAGTVSAVVNNATSTVAFIGCRAKGHTTAAASAGAVAYGVNNENPDSTWKSGRSIEGSMLNSTGNQAIARGGSYPINIDDAVAIIPAEPVSTSYPHLVVSNHANTTVTLISSLGWYRITKSGGVDGDQDAFAKSTLDLTDDFIITAIPRTDAKIAIGLASAGGTLWDATELTWYTDGTGALFAGDPVAGINAAGVFTVDEPLRIVRTDGVVSFYKGGATYAEGQQVSSEFENTDTLLVNVALWSASSKVDLFVEDLSAA